MGLRGSSLRARVALTVVLIGAAGAGGAVLAGCGSILGIDDGVPDQDGAVPDVGGGDDRGDDVGASDGGDSGESSTGNDAGPGGDAADAGGGDAADACTGACHDAGGCAGITCGGQCCATAACSINNPSTCCTQGLCAGNCRDDCGNGDPSCCHDAGGCTGITCGGQCCMTIACSINNPSTCCTQGLCAGNCRDDCGNNDPSCCQPQDAGCSGVWCGATCCPVECSSMGNFCCTGQCASNCADDCGNYNAVCCDGGAAEGGFPEAGTDAGGACNGSMQPCSADSDCCSLMCVQPQGYCM